MSSVDTFRWISVAVSMILGLGLARLLTAAVAQFHARRHRTSDWLPWAWATIIFCQHIDFWWNLEELAALVSRWDVGGFLVLVGLVLALFLSAALILPPTDSDRIVSLRDYFECDGRWALAVLAGYNALAIAANLAFWGTRITSLATLINAIVVVLPVIAFAAARPIRRAATIAYLAVAAAGMAMLSPLGY